ncbi:hypothetical protein [Kribbella pratensis]|uniref:Uncharacterized protein n=1 Tax=Kribbella pratensis TaxID=2512112 RepID=A0A4R8C5N3_9ACTN|nr:hypothetical protein [Kribbella pratensis]TDW70914.1 hypothetical protein EV653_4980 [Kribbella pratensis]
MNNTVVLLSTRRLPPTYFDQVREDLGDPNIVIDVVGWVAPSAWVADKVNTFTLIGPGRMPAQPAPDPEPAAEVSEEAPDAVIAPEAVADPETVVADEAKIAPAAAEVAAAEPAPQSAPQPSPQSKPVSKPKPTGAKRVVKAVEWRARRARKVAGRMLPKAIKTSAPVKYLRGQRATNDLGKNYWERVLSRRDVMATIDKADVVVALDAGAIWAGWNLGQRKSSTPVVLGLPAARREFDQLKAPAGNG